jgi:hypothetical protein
MADSDSATLHALGRALDEATLVGIEVDTGRRIAAVTLEVLGLPEVGAPPSDRRIQVILRPVGRVAAAGYVRSQPEARPRTLSTLQDLEAMELGGAVYGTEFFDVDPAKFAKRVPSPPVDWRSGSDGVAHSLTLFQDESPYRELDVCIWFDTLQLFAPDYSELTVEHVVEGARRWWAAWQRDDPRTQNLGIVRLKE